MAMRSSTEPSLDPPRRSESSGVAETHPPTRGHTALRRAFSTRWVRRGRIVEIMQLARRNTRLLDGKVGANQIQVPLEGSVASVLKRVGGSTRAVEGRCNEPW